MVLDFVHGHDAHAAVGAEGPESAGAGGGAAEADLDGAVGVDRVVLGGAAEGCAVLEGAAHVVTAGIAVGVDVDEADGAGVFCEGVEDGPADGVVATDGEGGDAGGDELVVEGLDFLESGLEFVGALDPAIAEVADAVGLEGGGGGGVVVGAEQG